jgi:hypothetical protein
VEIATIRPARQQTELRSDWQLAIDVDMVLRGQGADPDNVRGRQPRLVALAESAIAAGMSWIRPQAAFRNVAIQEIKSTCVMLANGAQVTGFGIARRLAGAGSVIAAIVTLGAELEKQIQRITKEDTALALALDGFGTAAVGELTTAVVRNLTQSPAGGQLVNTGPLFPGMRGWDLAKAQTQLFSLVDAAAIGVSLNSSFLMTPCKSASLVVGLGTMTISAGQSCDECGALATCRHRLSNP